MTSQRLESEGSNPSGPIADNGGTTACLPGQAKVVQELARADLAAGRSIYLTFFLAKLFKTVKRHLMTTDVFFIA